MSEYGSWTAFIPAFRAAAGQLNSYAIAGDWWRLHEALAADGIDLTAEQAAAWASLGFMPAEAEATILSGITAEQYREMEDHAEQQAGGPDELAAQRIGEWTEAGIFLNPDGPG